MPSLMMKSSTRKTSEPKLSEVARHVRVPAGIVTTAWSGVRDRCRDVFGVPFDRWQHGIGSIALGKRSNGQYAASVGGVVLSIPRQTGKTYLIGWMVFALATIIPGMTIVWTAHRTRTSNETFEKMRSMSRKTKVKPFVDRIRAVNGEQAIVFTNGSRILFGARENGFGRGFDEVDILVFDEAQILTENAMSDMVPATNAAKNGLVLLLGTPPRPGKDPGEVFAARRLDALNGDPDTAFVEFSADKGAQIIDWDQLAKANPSFPHRTGKTAILRMQKLLGSDESFMREAYGVWDDDVGDPPLISPHRWAKLVTDEVPDGVASFGIKFSPAGDWVSVSMALKKPDGSFYVEPIDSRSMAEGHGFLVELMVEEWRDSAAIVFDGRSDAQIFYQALRKAKVPDLVINLNKKLLATADYAAAVSGMVELVRAGNVSHPADPVLDGSIKESSRRIISKAAGTYGFGPIHEGADFTTADSAALALYGAANSKRRPGVARKMVVK